MERELTLGLELGERSLVKLPDPDPGGTFIRGRGRVKSGENAPEVEM